MAKQIACLGIAPIESMHVPAGRLKEHINTWKVLTKDPWVLATVEGYQIEFTSLPGQRTSPHIPHYTQDQNLLIEAEIKELLSKGAILDVTNPRGGFSSNLFLVPKKGGGQRPVINLKCLNMFVKHQHFKMEGIHTLRVLIRPKDWLAKVDLKDAYFAIPIHKSHHQFLRFHFQGKCYQFQCLPFGLSSAPWVFTKTLKPILALLWEMGVRLIAYIDDILVLAESQERAKDHVKGVVYLLTCLGFQINKEKSVVEPVQTLEFLGLTVDTISMELRLPGEKIKQIRAESRNMMKESKTSARALARLVGKMNATISVIPPAPLFYRHLQMALANALNSNHQSYETEISISQYCREELNWWDMNMSRWNGRSLLSQEIDMTIDSDASLIGWGAVCQGQQTGGPWSQSEKEMHINCLELLAATLAARTFLKHNRRISVLLRMDNTTAVAYINNLGGTVSKELVDLAKNLWMWCLERNINITAQHLPGIQNHIADAESRTMVDRSDWKLNPILFRKIVQYYGPIEVDLFASRLTAQCPVYFSWRPDPYATATDAFLQNWEGKHGYANPPWNLMGRVLSQVQRQQACIVLVAPVWKTQPWYPLLLEMIIAYPCLIKHKQVMLNAEPQTLAPQLAVWHISGKDIESRSFRRKLPLSCSNPGGLRQISLTTHSSGNGIAGVVHGVQIPFHVL